jgi:CDP-6-deoxy-D-xylo-4-hexulose-3-dehydrase
LFAGNILRQPAYLNYNFQFRVINSKLFNSKEIDDFIYEMLPNTDYAMKYTFWIGLWPGLDKNDLDFMVEKINSYLANQGIRV